MPRLNIVLSDTSEDIIVRLGPLLDLTTRTEVVRRALVLLNFACLDLDENQCLAIVNKDDRTIQREIVIL